MYLVDAIIDKCEKHSKSDWIPEAKGKRTLRIQEELYKDKNGSNSKKHDILNEAEELERCGLIKVKWFNNKSDIELIEFKLDVLPEIYKISGIIPKFEKQQKHLKFFESKIADTKKAWIKSYYEDCCERLILIENKEIPPAYDDVGLFECLEALDKLNEPMFKRIFSSRYLKNSKAFENEFKSKVIKIVRKFGTDFIDETMTDSSVLSQIFIEEYSSSLEIKGTLNLDIGENTINYSKFLYGTSINSETLKKANICGQQTIKRIVTVENKANFVSMPFEEGTLMIFCHGYFTPIEREFLIKLYEVLSKYSDIEYYHTGDLDYGGIRIFQYNRRIFPRLKPFNMDIGTFEKYIDYAEPIKKETLLKLKNIDEPLLNDLRDKMLYEGKGIEQENFINGD